MRYIKIGIISIAILFTAQACNFLFGDLYGNEGSGPRGMYMSQDSGESWAEINGSKENGKLRNAKIFDVFVEPGNPENLLAASNNAGVFASDTGGEKWVELLPDAIAYSVFISPENRAGIHVSGADLSKLATIWRSTDRGGVWQIIYNEPSRQASVSALTFDPLNPGIFYAGLSTGTILKSPDGGETWGALHKLGGRIVKIAVASDNARTVYAVSDTEGVFRSRDGGATWSRSEVFQVDFGGGRRGYNNLFVEKRDPETVYVATSHGLYRSRDGGNSWHKLNLPVTQDPVSVTAVTVNPDNSSLIFAAVNWTVYKSSDGGITWRTIQLPTRRVISDIEIDPNEPNRVYAGVR